MRNALAGTASPYLAMHADDPVAWQTWSADALARARTEGRLILVSSGFFACHWCHVLQQESFRDPVFAGLLNTAFLPIKVDREAEPALDAELRRAMQAISGRAGWPLNLILTPEGDPLYGFVYAPRGELLVRLQRLHALWQANPERLRALAQSASAELRPQNAPATPISPAEARQLLREALLAEADPLAGGFGHGAKFPHAPRLLAVLRLIEQQGDDALEGFLTTTLEAMARGGLRDQLGGGFFRYTIDPDWQLPHFEQMLIDQALLARIYLRAGRLFGRPDLSAVGHDLIRVILRDFAHPGGGFVAALSALDARRREGGGYLWDDAALAAVLDGPVLEAARRWTWVGHESWGPGRLPLRLGASEADRQAITLLAAARPRPVHPRDEQIPLAANGQLLVTLAEACQAGLRPACAAGGALAHFVRKAASGPIDELQAAVSLAAGLARWGQVEGLEDDRARARALLRDAARTFGGTGGWQPSARPLPPWSGRMAELPDDEYPSASAQWHELAHGLGVIPAVSAGLSLEVRRAPLQHATALAFWARGRPPPNPKGNRMKA
ncbi:DUF255 domain-containing protein [Thiofaba sp. EF100]|uniref:thioredoxin domain-containing protein n=1 Tax=Thiofaba sp. EF100 TaxID=3121274 RepID=UPI003221A97B